MDREKVIEKAERIMCSTVDRDMIDAFCEDVIALLKEQEAVKPKIDAFGHPYCPKCKILVYETWEFCPHCGVKMEWR